MIPLLVGEKGKWLMRRKENSRLGWRGPTPCAQVRSAPSRVRQVRGWAGAQRGQVRGWAGERVGRCAAPPPGCGGWAGAQRGQVRSVGRCAAPPPGSAGGQSRPESAAEGGRADGLPGSEPRKRLSALRNIPPAREVQAWLHLQRPELAGAEGRSSIPPQTMAKNKLRGQKSRSVFHIASQKNFKSKNKAKPVTTNLKKINIVNDEKVNRVNKAFVDIQKELANFSKGLSLEPLQKQLVSRNPFLLLWLIS
uniref:Ribosomal biosis factor n=1 Tax=Canis lupus familiaris TaxID=9615 RepID=A0A8P0TQE6_CANLF